MQNYGDGHASEMARTYDMALAPIQNQLQKLEQEGWFVSRLIGRTRVYYWNPANPLVTNLRQFLQSGLEAVPDSDRQLYYRQRRRPRRFGKMPVASDVK